MKLNPTRVAALVMAVLLVGAAGLGAAAFDTETTDSSTTSDVTSSSVDTITFDPSNDTDQIRVQTDGFANNSTDLALRIYPEDTETETVLYENASDPVAVNETAGQYAFIENHSDLSELPIGFETGDYGVEVVNESDDTIVAEGNITLDKSASDDSTARIMVADANLSSSPLVPDSYELTEAEAGILSTLNFLANDTEENTSTITAHSNIAGSDSTLALDIEDADTQDSIDAAVPDDAESGDWLANVHVASNLNWAPVYYDEAPDSVGSEDTYAVYDSSAQEIEVHHGDTFEDVEVTSVRMIANEDLGIFETWDRYNRLGLGFLGL